MAEEEHHFEEGGYEEGVEEEGGEVVAEDAGQSAEVGLHAYVTRSDHASRDSSISGPPSRLPHGVKPAHTFAVPATC